VWNQKPGGWALKVKDSLIYWFSCLLGRCRAGLFVAQSQQMRGPLVLLAIHAVDRKETC
jgi:hypothetical protein